MSTDPESDVAESLGVDTGEEKANCKLKEELLAIGDKKDTVFLGILGGLKTDSEEEAIILLLCLQGLPSRWFYQDGHQKDEVLILRWKDLQPQYRYN